LTWAEPSTGSELKATPDYTRITEEQYANRMILREAMLRHGFKPLEEEWWHFTLKEEPYPDTYFDYPVR
jgi:D-alanyl-D-alanine dipeptidase